MQANELAKAMLLAAKKKVAEQAKQKEIEGEQIGPRKQGVDTDVDRGGTDTENEGLKPARKPPRNKQIRKGKKVDAGGKSPKNK
jgi:hypothetical protein